MGHPGTPPPEGGAAALPAPSLDDLLLLRLALASPPGAGLPRSRVAADLAPLLAGGGGGGGVASAWRERFAAAVDRRLAAGEIIAPRRGRLALTAAGRTAAGAAFGDRTVTPPAGGASWSWVKVRDGLLVARALGRTADVGGTGGVRSADTLRAAILLRHHAPDALRLTGDGRAPSPTLREAVNLLAVRAVRARRDTPRELRAALLRDWLQGGAATAADADAINPPRAAARESPFEEKQPPAAGEEPLPAFAAAVLEIARRCETGRVGAEKVFVSHVWRRWRAERWSVATAESGVEAAEAAFKHRLAEANAAGLLRLSRADLAGVRAREDFTASEIRWHDARFHLLRLV